MLLPARRWVVLCMAAMMVCWGLGASTPSFQPTSQPSSLFVAPSVDQSLLTHKPSSESAIATGTPSPSISATAPPTKGEDQGAVKFEEEIADEDRTAQSAVSYIFYTLFTLAGVLALLYCCRKPRGSNVVNIDNHRYRHVRTTEEVPL